MTEALRPGLQRWLTMLDGGLKGNRQITADQLNRAFEAAVREVVDGHAHGVRSFMDLNTEAVRHHLVGEVVWKDQQ